MVSKRSSGLGNLFWGREFLALISDVTDLAMNTSTRPSASKISDLTLQYIVFATLLFFSLFFKNRGNELIGLYQ